MAGFTISLEVRLFRKPDFGRSWKRFPAGELTCVAESLALMGTAFQ